MNVNLAVLYRFHKNEMYCAEIPGMSVAMRSSLPEFRESWNAGEPSEIAIMLSISALQKNRQNSKYVKMRADASKS
jgi:hypothetical protein